MFGMKNKNINDEETAESITVGDTSSFSKGKLDRQNRLIVEVYGTMKEWVVYRTINNLVRIETADDHLKPEERLHLHNLNETAVETARIHALRPDSLRHSNISILGQIARGQIQCLQGNFDQAKEMLADAESRLRRLRTIEGRFQYHIAGSIVVLLFVASLLLPFFFPDLRLTIHKILVCGSIGGLLSMSIGIGKLEIDPYADWRINALAGVSRIVIAVLASTFIYFAMQAGLIFSSFSESSPYAIYALAIVAGFSETFVPNIIRNVETSSDKESNRSKSDAGG